MSTAKEEVRNSRVSALLSALLAMIFLTAGGAKLAGAEMLAQQFDNWGYPAWVLVVVGAAEVVGAVSLLVPFTRLVGAFVLLVVMIGAVSTHVIFNEWTSALVPVVILVVLAGLIYRGIVRRREEQLPSGEEVQITP